MLWNMLFHNYTYSTLQYIQVKVFGLFQAINNSYVLKKLFVKMFFDLLIVLEQEVRPDIGLE